MKPTLINSLIKQPPGMVLLLGTTLAAPLTQAVDLNDVDINDNGLIEISTIEELNQIRYNLIGTSFIDVDGNSIDTGCPVSGCIGYELVNDLDFGSNSANPLAAQGPFWNDGYGWEPIGSELDPFAAVFDGNGHSISNLFIDRVEEDHVGLFGVISSQPYKGAGVTNLVLQRAIVYGNNKVGGIVGAIENNYENEDVIVSGCAVSGVVSGEKYVGGMVGHLYARYGAQVHLFNNTTNILAVGADYTGGMVGYSGAGIGGVDSTTTVTLTDNRVTGQASGNSKVGGLVGFLASNNTGGPGISSDVYLERSQADAIVSGDNSIGGLIGMAYGSGFENTLSISDSEANGIVMAREKNAGGLIGHLEAGDYASVGVSAVSATGYTRSKQAVGGLIGSAVSGYADLAISNAYSWTGVRGDDQVGGLIGFARLYSDEAYFGISYTYATGPVAGQTNVGGLIGEVQEGEYFWQQVNVRSSYWDTSTSGLKKSAKGEGYTSEDLKCPKKGGDSDCEMPIYTGWSSNVWDFGSENDYPTLK
ncbi:hypothetical protein [Gynuella sunshinyii]|uniref:GLUG domain-containing protein n=1 Tax=Gynuella sunshinyii YC6258 TaxID=1445510 RepID=A0A0C5VTR1_9GAMM|nr:hypothetical protein [Gynuella sunshinyii]AJQ96688.1 hypothetical Protein YC6258_04656 [Gynuella sunshinyii YC6258]